MTERFSPNKLSDPTRDDLPRDLIERYRREALERTLEGKPYKILGEFRPQIPKNADFSFDSGTDDRSNLEKQFQDWLKEKGLFPRAFGIIYDRKPEGYNETVGVWHRDGIDAEDDLPDKRVTIADEEQGENLKLLWANHSQTELRVHADKTTIPTEPYQVVAVNNRLVDHRRPANTKADRILISSDSLVLIK